MELDLSDRKLQSYFSTFIRNGMQRLGLNESSLRNKLEASNSQIWNTDKTLYNYLNLDRDPKIQKLKADRMFQLLNAIDSDYDQFKKSWFENNSQTNFNDTQIRNEAPAKYNFNFAPGCNITGSTIGSENITINNYRTQDD